MGCPSNCPASHIFYPVGGWGLGGSWLSIWLSGHWVGLTTFKPSTPGAECSALEGEGILCGHPAPFHMAPPLFSPPQSSSHPLLLILDKSKRQRSRSTSEHWSAETIKLQFTSPGDFK